MGFTAVFQEVSEGYIAFVEEIPGANTQGATLEEARENLQEAVQLVLAANRELSRESAFGLYQSRNSKGLDRSASPGDQQAFGSKDFPRSRGARSGCMTARR